MKRCYIFAVAALVAAAVLAPVTVAAADAKQMRSGQAVKMDRAGRLPELGAMAIAPAAPAAPTAEVPNIRVPYRLLDAPNVDAPAALGPKSPIVGPRAPTALLSFGGFDSDDNSDLFGFRIMPPDTQGDVGLEHYVQWNNLGFKIFDKAGNLLNGPLGSPGNIFWAGFGGTCETENDGDPIVLYDHVAGRWFFSQFEVSSGLGLQCVAVSDGEDPAGPYTRYAFPISIAGFNDYPKIGLWTSADGTQSAYHVTTNEFSPFQGVNLTALDRDAILAGAPATFVQFTIPPAAGTDPFAFSLQPGHLEGPVLPTAGTCETYIQAFDTETWGAAGDPDGYRTWEFCVDFDTPANSTLTEYPFIAAGFEFDANMCDFGDCVPQQGTSQLLDTLSQFTMYRFAVRDVEGTFTGVISHTVDLGGDLGGVQWAQFDLSGAAPALADIGQLDVGDGLHRWMPSIAQDRLGNIAVGYSRSGTTAFPSFYYTGRFADAIPGTLQPETVCIDGTGHQTGGGRWGDYASVSIDPADDCTFWLTNEYVETTGSFQWDTQVCTFKFPDCDTGVCEPTEDVEESCNDGLDNDCDGDFDCSDSDCADEFVCTCEPEPEICDDGIDNDCDGFTDCDDTDCALDPVCLPPGPDNDFCEDAIAVECGETVSGTTISANFDDAGFCGTSNTAPGVWYSVAHDGLITASTCNQADYDTKLSVYGGECGDLGCIGGNDDTSGCAGFTTELTWPSDGSENLLLVHGFGTSTGNFDLTVSCEDIAENDDCEDAEGPYGAGDIVSGSTTNATLDEPPDIDCGTSVTAPGVWYDVIGTGNTMTASTCNDGDDSTGGADYDTKISVYCADCEVKECITGADDAPGCSGFSTQVDWPTQEGRTYKVLVHGFGSGTGDFDMALLDDGEPVPPGVANDCDGIPADQDLCPGTYIPESVPTSGNLKPNMSALQSIDGVFTTAAPNPEGMVYTTLDTGGCSCEQIVDELGKGKGHLKFGCSYSVMDEWVEYASSFSFCGDCLEANGTPGCENAECEAAICAIDPFCCDVFWDGLCAAEAEEICLGEGICTALAAPVGPLTVPGGRSHVAEPISKDPNYTPKEQ